MCDRILYQLHNQNSEITCNDTNLIQPFDIVSFDTGIFLKTVPMRATGDQEELVFGYMRIDARAAFIPSRVGSPSSVNCDANYARHKY